MLCCSLSEYRFLRTAGSCGDSAPIARHASYRDRAAVGGSARTVVRGLSASRGRTFSGYDPPGNPRWVETPRDAEAHLAGLKPRATPKRYAEAPVPGLKPRATWRPMAARQWQQLLRTRNDLTLT